MLDPSESPEVADTKLLIVVGVGAEIVEPTILIFDPADQVACFVAKALVIAEVSAFRAKALVIAEVSAFRARPALSIEIVALSGIVGSPISNDTTPFAKCRFKNNIHRF